MGSCHVTRECRQHFKKACDFLTSTSIQTYLEISVTADTYTCRQISDILSIGPSRNLDFRECQFHWPCGFQWFCIRVSNGGPFPSLIGNGDSSPPTQLHSGFCTLNMMQALERCDWLSERRTMRIRCILICSQFFGLGMHAADIAAPSAVALWNRRRLYGHQNPIEGSKFVFTPISLRSREKKSHQPN